MTRTANHLDIRWEMIIDEDEKVSWIGTLDEFCAHVEGKVFENVETKKRRSRFRLLHRDQTTGRPDWNGENLIVDDEAQTAEAAKERAETALLEFVNEMRRGQLAVSKGKKVE